MSRNFFNANNHADSQKYTAEALFAPIVKRLIGYIRGYLAGIPQSFAPEIPPRDMAYLATNFSRLNSKNPNFFNELKANPLFLALALGIHNPETTPMSKATPNEVIALLGQNYAKLKQFGLLSEIKEFAEANDLMEPFSLFCYHVPESEKQLQNFHLHALQL